MNTGLSSMTLLKAPYILVEHTASCSLWLKFIN